MAQAQKISDMKILGFCSTNGYPNYKNKDRIHKIKYIKDLIQDLECNGPAGLIHIMTLSNIIQRPIKIWNANGSLNKIIGGRETGHPVDIEYHAFDSEQVGHWTLRGGKDPNNVIIDLNSCLFSVIGSQIKQDPLRLRKWTILKLKDNFQNLIDWINKIFRLENNRAILMIGGAKYTGTSVADAAELLDNSEARCPSGHPNTGHARAHTPQYIENYTRKNPDIIRTAFLTTEDQNIITHIALHTQIARNALMNLNRGSSSELIEISRETLKETGKNLFAVREGEDYELPKAQMWQTGEKVGEEKDMLSVALILRHYRCQTQDDDDVLIFTCFPNIDTKRETRQRAKLLHVQMMKKVREQTQEERKEKERERKRMAREQGRHLREAEKRERERKAREEARTEEAREDREEARTGEAREEEEEAEEEEEGEARRKRKRGQRRK